MEIEATEVFEATWEALNSYQKDDAGNVVLASDGKPVRKYRYIIHEGSSRSSKTYSIIQAYYLYAMQSRNKRLSVWRDTQKDCKDTVGYDMSQIYPGMPMGNLVQYRESKGMYSFLLTKSQIEINGTDNEKKVMGYNGDGAWLNEPYEISQGTFDQIDQRTSDFLIIDWNPKKAHWIEKIKKDKRALVIHSTFKKNPFCPPEQRIKIESYQPVSMSRAVESRILTENEAMVYDIPSNEIGLNSEDLLELSRCQENEYKESASAYNWSVYGLGLKAEKPNRIFKWKKIRLQDYLALDVETFIGVDWGKSDPFGIVEVKYYDRALYCRELNYDSENEIRRKMSATERAQIAGSEEGLVTWLFAKLGIGIDKYIICDPNRKLKIIALRQVGFDNALAAHKPPGSVRDGIDLLDNLTVYYTDDSPNIEYEQENYSWKVDRYGIVEDEPIDADNHCFVGETLINTDRGLVPIKEVSEGDLVLTSKGYRRVLKRFENGVKSVTKRLIQFDDFSIVLDCTDNHKIKTDVGWVEIGKLKGWESLFLSKSLMENGNVLSAGPNLQSTGMQRLKPVRIDVLEVYEAETFDLMVDDCHEYFANGVLVHNCVDPIRYVAQFLQMEGVINIA